MKKNKAIITFLVKFFISYLIMVGLYSYYLSKTQKKETLYSCAPVTEIVANQTVKAIQFLGYKAAVEQHQDELSLKVMVNGNYVSRVIEGCNSISIIILFLAFIIAFSGSIKITIIYGIVGSILIYITNIFRIAILSIGILEYPAQQEILHSLVFPAIIYGMVFLLWVIWVNKFSDFKKQQNE
jgi:exosortase family protein XrtF